MISDEELRGKVEAAQRGPNYCKLVQIALKSGSPTNAANTAGEQEYSLEEQQNARWIRMYLERRLFNEPDFLCQFLKIMNLQKEMPDGGAKVTTNKESMKVGYLTNPGRNHLLFSGILYFCLIVITMITAKMLVRAVARIQSEHFDFKSFLGVGSFVVLCYVLVPIFAWIGAHRMTKGNYRTYLPANVFRVESAYKKGPDVFAVVSGISENVPGFVFLQVSTKLEIIGFPEKAIGPNEFYLDVEDHYTQASGTKGGQWYQDARKWRTCTFIPVPAEETA